MADAPHGPPPGRRPTPGASCLKLARERNDPPCADVSLRQVRAWEAGAMYARRLEAVDVIGIVLAAAGHLQ
jgi:hypothetical protein